MRRTLLLVVTLVACGGGGKDNDHAGNKADDKVASCNQPKIGGCREYRGMNLAAGTDLVKKLCDAGAQISASTFDMKPCPTDGVTASCAKPEGKDYYYAANPIPLADLEKQCKDFGGTWGK